MKRYRVIINGKNMGVYFGKTKNDALNKYAHDAGYQGFSDLLVRIPGANIDDIAVIELIDGANNKNAGAE